MHVLHGATLVDVALRVAIVSLAALASVVHVAPLIVASRVLAPILITLVVRLTLVHDLIHRLLLVVLAAFIGFTLVKLARHGPFLIVLVSWHLLRLLPERLSMIRVVRAASIHTAVS